MNSLDKNIYARECTMNIEPNGSWYIPYHGVHRPNKRIRWGWYMAPARSFKEEVWINDSLVVRIRLWLFRFREYDIAFMAETESVFYQLMVFKEGRCCLKLLCWKDGNFGNTIIDCQMNVLVFCATFSPDYSNCTLKKAPAN